MNKVKPLPCTLTEVFHATAAWRQNPTRGAGIAFQTGMPVDNVRPPVISITIIPSGLGPHQACMYLRTDKLPSCPNPSFPFVPSTRYRLSEPANPFCHHQHILPVRTLSKCVVQTSAVQAQPKFKANLQRAMHNGWP